MKDIFLESINKQFGDKVFTTKDAENLFTKLKLGEIKNRKGSYNSDWLYIYNNILLKNRTEQRGKYCLSDSVDIIKNEAKKTIKKDWDILNNDVAENSQSKPVSNMVMNLIPKKDLQYVPWGHFKDIKTILQSNIFYPIFVTGLSGNGKTSMIREVCAKLKRDLIRINITIETDEDDLLGGFRLVNGETVWQDGPLVVAMKQGAVALIDEVDLASHKIMCLQPIMEGQPIYLKKINEVVYPAKGFNIVATANTKGKGSEDGRFMGTNILNEAFLDRFSATFYQEYPSPVAEAKILKKQFSLHEIEEDGFVDNLVKWADVIRRSFKEGAVDEIITTRRLIDITKSFSIFRDRMKSVVMCLERFDDEIRESFVDFYTKIDAGVSMEDLMNEGSESFNEEDEKVEEKEEDNVPF